MNDLTDKEIRQMLDTHEEMERSLKLRIEEALKERREVMDEIQVSFIRAREYSEVKLSRSYHVSDPVFDAYIKLNENGNSNRLDLLETEINDKMDRLSELSRICAAYHRLADIVPVGYNIVYELVYTPVGKRRYAWKSLVIELGRSKRYISEGINLVIKLIGMLYDSEHSTSQISRLNADEAMEIFATDADVTGKMKYY